MTTKHLPIGRRVLAGAAALAVGFVGLGSAAFAAEPALAPGNIDGTKTGSLIIHKHESGSQNQDGTPDGKTNTGGTGVADVVFTLYPITNLDLTTFDAWEGLASLKVPATACDTPDTPSLTLPGDAGAAIFGDDIVSEKTDANGDVTVSNLAVAAYLVCETAAPDNVQQKAAPFLVTIPFPNNDANAPTSNDGEWLYDVNVYPKNTVVEAPTKGIDVISAGLQTDGQLVYPITAKVPSIASTDWFTYFIITDDLDASMTDGEVSKVEIQEAGQTTWTTVDSANYTKTDGQDIKVSFTPVGLTYLATKPNAMVRVTVTAKANSVPANGNITNIANLYVGTDTKPGGDNPPENPPTPPDTPPTPPTPTNPVVSNWGNLIIEKQDADNDKTLAGAKFEIYLGNPAFGTCTTTIATDDPDTALDESAKVSVNGVTEFESDAQGRINIAGLFIDKKEGAPGQTVDQVVPDNASRCYVLKEIAAPAGYTLPADSDALTAVKVTAGQTTTVDEVIDNTKQNVPQLPLTGANGQLLMTIGGASLILIAAGATLVARRRAQD